MPPDQKRHEDRSCQTLGPKVAAKVESGVPGTALGVASVRQDLKRSRSRRAFEAYLMCEAQIKNISALSPPTSQ